MRWDCALGDTQIFHPYVVNIYLSFYYIIQTDEVGLPSTGWRRLIGSRKLQIIFHKRATKYKSPLWEMTYKDKGFYGSSPPCTWYITCVTHTWEWHTCMNESCHIFIRFEWTSMLNSWYVIWPMCHTHVCTTHMYECVMSHIYMFCKEL